NAQSVVKKINTDEGTENLLYDGHRLFASNYNFGASFSVSAIDPVANTLIKNIDVAGGPAGMVTDVNGKLWVVCVGAWDATEGHLYKINAETLEVEREIMITGVPGIDIAVTPDKTNIIYSVGKSVFSLPIASAEAPTEPLFEAADVTTLNALNVD